MRIPSSVLYVRSTRALFGLIANYLSLLLLSVSDRRVFLQEPMDLVGAIVVTVLHAIYSDK